MGLEQVCCCRIAQRDIVGQPLARRGRQKNTPRLGAVDKDQQNRGAGCGEAMGERENRKRPSCDLMGECLACFGDDSYSRKTSPPTYVCFE